VVAVAGQVMAQLVEELLAFLFHPL